MREYVIAIDREFGSGGLETGQLVAEKLGIKCYNQELLRMAAKESGLSPDLFELHDERPTNSFLYSLVMEPQSLNGYSPSRYTDVPLNHKVFMAVFDTIKKLASRESCVIVGRCADYALEDYDGCVSVFIQGKRDYKIGRLQHDFGWNPEEARSNMKRLDKRRASYYNYFSNKKWGEAKTYDLTLESSKLKPEGCAEMIKRYLEIKRFI